MFRVVLLALCLNSVLCSSAGLDCVHDDKIVDFALDQTKNQISETASHVSLPFDQRVNLINFLNFGVQLSATDGKWAASRWSRFGNTTHCEDSIHQSDEGYFTFDDVVFDYDKISAKFWSIEADGKLTIKFKPVFSYYIVNGTEECALVSLKMENIHQYRRITERVTQ
ncbi:unnamed protein product [Nesidiocoris tenuis]|uniref:Uncharacterized protein n=1 Tax=Nesidiocoris tenuis TaxID=355587 RepID=A0A6H5HEJ1_9HEMI|nr:unnamed protein product [Nesidiocoris tenuis]